MANNDNGCANILQLFDDGPMPVFSGIFFSQYNMTNIDISIDMSWSVILMSVIYVHKIDG